MNTYADMEREGHAISLRFAGPAYRRLTAALALLLAGCVVATLPFDWLPEADDIPEATNRLIPLSDLAVE